MRALASLMTWKTGASVLMSGAETSRLTPRTYEIALVNRRVSRCFSPELMTVGSHWTPPFAPPYGMSTTAKGGVHRAGAEHPAVPLGGGAGQHRAQEDDERAWQSVYERASLDGIPLRLAAFAIAVAKVERADVLRGYI